MGSLTVNVVPTSGVLATSIRPRCASTIYLAMDNPSPEPWLLFAPLRETR